VQRSRQPPSRSHIRVYRLHERCTADFSPSESLGCFVDDGVALTNARAAGRRIVPPAFA
jgi:hypothetical protein